MPNNFAHVGLIHLILPNAKIIDARRHPLGCCFSGFKQHFARGQAFSYDLADLGRYYRDYVELMAHFDAVLPGRVHRVLYERMVDDPEARGAAAARLLRPAVRGGLPALPSRTTAPCAPPVPSRCASRSSPTAWTTGAITSLARPAEGALAPVLEDYPTRLALRVTLPRRSAIDGSRIGSANFMTSSSTGIWLSGISAHGAA